MRVIQLDASEWKEAADFYNDLLFCLEAPHWHGTNVNALVDSMVYGSINGIDPPYKIWISRTEGMPAPVKQQIDWMVEAINEHQAIAGDKGIEFQVDL